ncbi:MAG: gluconokinase [Pseudonocardiales bacterium]|jgi:gluconokinase|nr:gluconokinase [Pseudonocardiales bacterium]
MTPVVVVMGVAGSGKTTIATLLARRLGWDEIDGDALHPPANIAKMAAGRPLDDADRAPWLARIAAWIDEHQQRGRAGIVTCSALRRSYRDELRRPGVAFVLLSADKATLAARLSARTDHFMPPGLLDSQLATFEPPGPDEQVLSIDTSGPPDAVAVAIVEALQLATWQA